MIEPYRPRVAASAGRAIQYKLPEGIAVAVVEFITGTLLDNPRRVGNALHHELTRVHSARRGAVRILYEIDDEVRQVTVPRRAPSRRLSPALSHSLT